jgi:HemY protein
MASIFTPTEYVSFGYKGIAMEIPLWGVMVILLGMFFVIFFILYCINVLLNLIPNFKKWLQKRRVVQANEYTTYAISFLSEGNVQDAAKYALKGLKNSSIPLVNYLSLAATANAQGEIYLRDKYFAEACEKFARYRTAILLAKAKMQFEKDDFSGCITTIQGADKKVIKHPRAVYLLSLCYQQAKRWQDLINMLPILNKLFPDGNYQNLEIQAYQNEIKNKNNRQALVSFWSSIPKKMRRNNSLILEYATNLNKLGAGVEAEKVLRDSLNEDLDLHLVQLYGKVECVADLQMKQISTWIEKYPNNPDLLLTAAKICVKNKLWGKARSYLEHSLAIDPKPESFAELGNLLEYLGEQEQSKSCFRKGLLQVTDANHES